MVVAVSMSEPHAGTALTDLKTRGKLSGDKIILNGSKRWCSGGGHADAYVVYCRLSNDPGAKGIGAVLVEKGTGLYLRSSRITYGLARHCQCRYVF